MTEAESLTITKTHTETISANGEPKKKEIVPGEVTAPEYKHNYGLKVGDIDEDGVEIEYIYECEPGKYFIYHVKDFDLQIKAEDAILIGKNAKFNKLLMQVGDYLSNKSELRPIYITHIAYAIKNLYDGNDATARESLASTFDNMTRYLKRRAVVPYLFGSFVLVLISLISYFITYRYGDLNDFGHIMFTAVVLSSLGGFLSVAISLQHIVVDIQDSYFTKVIHGFIRIIIAMISGVIIYFLLEGKVIFAFFKDIQSFNAYYVAFFFSGFSEKFVSNLMFDFEKKSSAKDNGNESAENK